eukprot:TRINITY_DN8599_c0_g1_i2.p1 TRINITY_DN8599_c0_g1~~TRINITY_DN8599_c0_g1_i2.p1  ORF type:complete len:107 (+),score=9.42 TRINITY_DN8599_c0_g1_i2:327-647(+)
MTRNQCVCGQTNMEQITRACMEALTNVECPLCLEIFYNPSTIQCGHTFCSGCLKGYLINCRSKSKPLICPLCREVLPNDKIQVSYVLVELIKTIFPQKYQERANMG